MFQGQKLSSHPIPSHLVSVRSFLWLSVGRSVGRSSVRFVRSMERVPGCPRRAGARYSVSIKIRCVRARGLRILSVSAWTTHVALSPDRLANDRLRPHVMCGLERLRRCSTL